MTPFDAPLRVASYQERLLREAARERRARQGARPPGQGARLRRLLAHLRGLTLAAGAPHPAAPHPVAPPAGASPGA
jgi:hypothetical protein